ncbi:MAG: EamA family transporter [Bauldia sp.]|nr:EamA family transporter [Bauldia sp.]
MSQYIPFILFTVVTNAAAQLMLKQGMNSIGAFQVGSEPILALVFRIIFNPFVFFGLMIFVVSMGSHLFVLSRVDVSFAFPFLSIAYVLVAVYAHFFMSETLTFNHIVGIGLIVGGTVFISMK